MSGVRFVYVPAADLNEMRRFYGDLLALDEIFFSADEELLAYDCDGLQFTIYGADVEPIDQVWATQPGWRGDTVPAISWSVELPAAAFRGAVDRLRSAQATRLHAEPVWVGYWSFPVRDPMGNTVEVTWPELSELAERTWTA